MTYHARNAFCCPIDVNAGILTTLPRFAEALAAAGTPNANSNSVMFAISENAGWLKHTPRSLGHLLPVKTFAEKLISYFLPRTFLRSIEEPRTETGPKIT